MDRRLDRRNRNAVRVWRRNEDEQTNQREAYQRVTRQKHDFSLRRAVVIDKLLHLDDPNLPLSSEVSDFICKLQTLKVSCELYSPESVVVVLSKSPRCA